MRFAITLLAAAALVACGRPDPVADEAEDTAGLPPASEQGASPSGGAPSEGTPAGNSVVAASGQLPRALQGRWGMTPGDCAPRAGQEGLLVIDADGLRFHESRAVPAADVQTSADSISGDFAFTGEGQRWTKHVTLELQDGVLVRTERNPVASFRYVRCE